MFDLLGFWFNVSVATIGLLLPLLYIVPFILRVFVERVTGDRSLALKLREKILDTDSCRDYIVFKKLRIEEVSFEAVCVTSTIISILFFSGYILGEFNIITEVSTGSSNLAPYTGWLSLSLVIYFGVEYLARKMWNFKTKVDKIIDKGDS